MSPRTTKYRAWTGREMVVVQSLCFNDKGCIWYGSGIHMGWAFTWPNAEWTKDDPKPDDNDLKPVMQWTGMRDKGGRDIYEGDYVKLSDSFLSRNHGHYMSGYGHIWRAEGGEYVCSYNHEYSECSDPLWHLNEDDMEVVGNCFQNEKMPNE